MDLAERVGWPRETTKWDIFFELGGGFGVERGDGTSALSAMVALPRHEGVTFVAMMVVDPDEQGQGLGRRLLERALDHVDGPAMLYATKAGEPVYRRLGFEEVARVTKHIGALTSAPRARPAGIRVRGDHDPIALGDLVAADAGAFGAPRPAMMRALLSRARAVVVDGDGGSAVLWNNGFLDVVGPVVARDEARAIELVDAALGEVSPDAPRVRIDVSADSASLARHVEARGLARLDDAPLMTWPAPLHRGDRARYHAIALQGLG